MANEKVCVLTRTEAISLEHGLKPSCYRHNHVSRLQANEMMSSCDVQRIFLSGRFRVHYIIQRTWRKVYHRTGIARLGPKGQLGPGRAGMQLVRGS